MIFACSAQVSASLLPRGALRSLLGVIDYDAFRVTLSEPDPEDDVRQVTPLAAPSPSPFCPFSIFSSSPSLPSVQNNIIPPFASLGWKPALTLTLTLTLTLALTLTLTPLPWP